MAARAFKITVQGLLDGATPLVVPDPLPSPVNGVTEIDAGAGVAVGSIDLGELFGPDATSAPIWLRSLQTEFQTLTRAARFIYDNPGSRALERVTDDLAGSPPLMRLLTLGPRCIVPQGGALEILTDDTDETFSGLPVAGPHFIYLEVDSLASDEEVGLVQDLQGEAESLLGAQGQEGELFQAVAADLTQDILIVQPPDRYSGSLSAVMQVDRADVTIGTAPAAGESMVVDINRVRDGSGAVTTIATITIDNTFAANTRVPIPVTQLANILSAGDRIQVDLDYTAGGGPAPMDNTLVTFTLRPILLQPLPV